MFSTAVLYKHSLPKESNPNSVHFSEISSDVTVPFPPTIVATCEVSGSGNVFAVGANTTLNCTVSGVDMLDNPTLEYVWKRDEETIVEEENPTLVLDALATDDSGSYTCVVTIGHALLVNPVTVTSPAYCVKVETGK